MSTLTISLDDSLARRIEESAKREQKSVSDWISERIRLDAERMAGLESRAAANGYPPGWLALYGSLADDEGFTAPARTTSSPLKPLDGN
jgi:hypothetical protein